MMHNKKPTNKIVLESDTLSIHGYRKNDLDWFEFDTCIAGKEYKCIGGEDRKIFLDQLYKILTKNEGKSITEIDNFKYISLVGGNEAEFMGCLVVSGYNSFNFFRLNGEIKNVLFLDRDMKLIAHTELMQDFKETWIKKISQFR